MSFGKKGLAAGHSAQSVTPASRQARKPSPFAQPAIRPAEPLDPEAAKLAAQREGFIAAERGRGVGLQSSADTAQYTNTAPSYASHGYQSAAPSYFERFASREPSIAMAYVFWFLLANLSAHRLYLGAHQSALQQMGLMFGSLILGLVAHPAFFLGYLIWALWVLADVFLIPGLHRKRMAALSGGFGNNAHVFA